MQNHLKLIPKISLPESLTRELSYIQDAMLATWKKKEGDWDFTSGYMPRPELDDLSDIKWEVLGYIHEINRIIDHLNIVITDINFLSSHPNFCTNILGGAASTRHQLLVRTFFYEVFRTKEIHNKFLKYLRNRDLLTKVDVDEFKAEFLNIFDSCIKLRNKMVHDVFAFPGTEHLDLLLAEIATTHNMVFKSNKTGNILTTNDAIGKVCEVFLEMALPIGNNLAVYFETFSRTCCDAADALKEDSRKQ